MIRQAKIEDLNEIVNVHIECFPDGFSTRLGEAKKSGGGILLCEFYKEYMLKVPELFLVVTNENQDIQGFCMGYYCEENEYIKHYFKHNLFHIGVRILWLLGTFDKIAWKKMRTTLKKSNPSKTVDYKIDEIPLSEKGDLLSICVLPQCRGNGMAQALISRYEEILKEKKRKICILTVRLDNEQGVYFYEKNGYTTYKESEGNKRTYVKYI